MLWKQARTMEITCGTDRFSIFQLPLTASSSSFECNEGPWEISSVQISLPSGVLTMPIISRQVDCQDFMHVAFLPQVEDTVQQKS